jgi:nitroreductase
MNTASISSDTLLAALHWRYATKKYDPAKKISAADWSTLEQALILSASSYGLQPYKFVVVTDPALRARLLPASYGQTQVVDASHFVVFARRLDITAADAEHFIARTAEVRGLPVEALNAYRDILLGDVVNGPRNKWAAEWAARQAYIALGNFLASAALLGIDATPMEGFEPPKYDEILGLTAQGFGAVVVAAAGYRAADDKYAALAKVRFPASELIDVR